MFPEERHLISISVKVKIKFTSLCLVKRTSSAAPLLQHNIREKKASQENINCKKQTPNNCPGAEFHLYRVCGAALTFPRTVPVSRSGCSMTSLRVDSTLTPGGVRSVETSLALPY
jgi:hypothetical protein